eukprot:scaffold14814_cov128-Skeletonema_dohrnii-CCMP3373.AAC.4
MIMPSAVLKGGERPSGVEFKHGSYLDRCVSEDIILSQRYLRLVARDIVVDHSFARCLLMQPLIASSLHVDRNFVLLVVYCSR